MIHVRFTKTTYLPFGLQLLVLFLSIHFSSIFLFFLSFAAFPPQRLTAGVLCQLSNKILAEIQSHSPCTSSKKNNLNCDWKARNLVIPTANIRFPSVNILAFRREWERTQRLFGKMQLFKYIYKRQIFPPTTHLLENKASRAQLVSTTVTADSADYRCGTWSCFKEFCSKAQNSWQLASPAAGGWAAAVNGGSPRLTGGAVLQRDWCVCSRDSGTL